MKQETQTMDTKAARAKRALTSAVNNLACERRRPPRSVGSGEGARSIQGGSISSAASSSGCSSVESSSSIPAEIAQRGANSSDNNRALPGEAINQAGLLRRKADDGLEMGLSALFEPVDSNHIGGQLTGLRSGRGAAVADDRDKTRPPMERANYGDRPMQPGLHRAATFIDRMGLANGNHCNAALPMSEFSAFTLRKSLKRGLILARPNNPALARLESNIIEPDQSAAGALTDTGRSPVPPPPPPLPPPLAPVGGRRRARQTGETGDRKTTLLRRSSTIKLSSSGLRDNARLMGQHFYCCCCAGHCKGDGGRKAALPPSSLRRQHCANDAIIGFDERRLAGRKNCPLISRTAHREPPDPAARDGSQTDPAARCGVQRHQRRFGSGAVRRPLPVAPPVVPLYKEMALFGDQLNGTDGANDQHLERQDGRPEPAAGLLNGHSNGDDERSSMSSIRCISSSGLEDLGGSAHLPGPNKQFSQKNLSNPPGRAGTEGDRGDDAKNDNEENSDEVERTSARVYSDNWNRLGGDLSLAVSKERATYFKPLQGARSCLQLGGSRNGDGSILAPPCPGSAGARDAGGDSSVASWEDISVERKFSMNLGPCTVGRRTAGRLIGKLKQSFLFSLVAGSSPLAAPNKNPIEASTVSKAPEGSGRASSSLELTAAEEPDCTEPMDLSPPPPIYDTPESGPPAGRQVVRPAQPPPPPPPPPPLPGPLQSQVGRTGAGADSDADEGAKRRGSGGAQGDCAQAAQSQWRAGSNVPPADVRRAKSNLEPTNNCNKQVVAGSNGVWVAKRRVPLAGDICEPGKSASGSCSGAASFVQVTTSSPATSDDGTSSDRLGARRRTDTSRNSICRYRIGDLNDDNWEYSNNNRHLDTESRQGRQQEQQQLQEPRCGNHLAEEPKQKQDERPSNASSKSAATQTNTSLKLRPLLQRRTSLKQVQVYRGEVQEKTSRTSSEEDQTKASDLREPGNKSRSPCEFATSVHRNRYNNPWPELAAFGRNEKGASIASEQVTRNSPIRIDTIIHTREASSQIAKRDMGSSQSSSIAAFVEHSGNGHQAKPNKPSVGRNKRVTLEQEVSKSGACNASSINKSLAAKTGKMVVEPAKLALKLKSSETASNCGGRQSKVKFKIADKPDVGQVQSSNKYRSSSAQVDPKVLKLKGPSASERENVLDSMDPLERRRKSIQNGDVFIYPSLYKDLDECHLCSRDNRVCECSLRENEDLNKDKGELDGAKEEVMKSDLNEKNLDGTSNKQAKGEPEEDKKISRRDSAFEHGCKEQVAVIEEDERENQVAEENEEEFKTVYRISIATASIDQESNLLRMSTPKIIVPNSSRLCNNKPLEECSSPAEVARRDLDTGSVYLIDRASPNGLVPLATNMTLGSSTSERVDESTNTARRTTRSPVGDGSSDAPEFVAETLSNGIAAGSPFSHAEGEAIRVDETSIPKAIREVGKGSLILLSPRRITTTSPAKNDGCETMPVVEMEAKVTAISIGSPTNSPKSLNLKELIPPLLDAPERTDQLQVTVNAIESTNSGEKNRDRSEVNSLLNETCDTMNLAQLTEVAGSTYVGSKMNKKIRPIIEEEEHITCNLCLGDSIKVASASIRIDANQLRASPARQAAAATTNNQDHTSIVPIQSLSTRRRNMATKLSRQAIDEDDYECRLKSHSHLATSSTHPELSSPSKSMTTLNKGSGLIVMEGDTESSYPNAGGNGRSCGESCTDVLEYSPILTSVRDYINNINCELRDDTALATATTLEDVLSIDQVAIERIDQLNQHLITSVGQSGTKMDSADLQLACNVQSNTGGSQPTPELVMSDTISNADFGGVATISELLVVESPKKSIFDGASRAEILEYLEDARERVPEILMAADEVMVIGDNELIVVNQLEPNSPATPISIVEAIEMIGTANSTSAASSDDPISSPDCANRSGSNLCGSSSSPEQAPHNTPHHHPNQLRKHLQQMYESSKMAAASSSLDTNNNDLLDGIKSSPLSDECGDHFSSLASNSDNGQPLAATSLDSSQDQFMAARRACSEFKSSFSCVTGATLDSLDDQVSENLAQDEAAACLQVTEIYGSDANSDRTMHLTEASTLRLVQPLEDHNTECSSGEAVNDQCSQTIGESLVASSNSRLSSLVARRNSSDGCSQNYQQLIRERNRVLDMMLLDRRHPNRRSISSSSSSPPSSASPTSGLSASSTGSASSQQTSGNCSAASTFYASSSLSCSSPFLAGSNLVPVSTASSVGPIQPAPTVLKRNQASKTLASIDDSTGEHLETNSQQPSRKQLDSASLVSNLVQVERDDSGLGSDMVDKPIANKTSSSSFASNTRNLDLHLETVGNRLSTIEEPPQVPHHQSGYDSFDAKQTEPNIVNSRLTTEKPDLAATMSEPTSVELKNGACKTSSVAPKSTLVDISSPPVAPTFSSSANLMSRTAYGHYATMNRLNNYFVNRHPFELSSSGNSDSTMEFQCLDCDQFIDVDQTTLLHKTNALRLLRESDQTMDKNGTVNHRAVNKQLLTNDQLDRAYIAAMNGLPLCKLCEKKRIERKEIISEFVETELKYGRDLKIIHDEFYRPMQIAGLLSKDQINGVFLNLEELIMAHCRFADRLEISLREAHSMGDTDYNTINMGRLFVSSAEMLHTFESYCIRQGSAACLLARLAKEKELLRIFLRVSQMENTLLRRMNLAAFLMVPVQRVTKYPLLLNRLYKVTAYHHKDREALRDAQLKVELHLEHINQQTKGFGATNKIWRRISNLSAPVSNRRGLINAEDIGYIKLRKTAMDMLKWDRDETQFIHSGKLNFAPLSEFLIKQKMKPIRYMAAHALLVVLGKPNWKYRPDLVKSNLDSKLITLTPGGTGVKEAALLLFREKNGRFVPCREPLFLSNCVLSNDCSQFNSECPLNQPGHHGGVGSIQSKTSVTNSAGQASGSHAATANNVTGQTGATQVSNKTNNRGKLGSSESSRDSGNGLDVQPRTTTETGVSMQQTSVDNSCRDIELTTTQHQTNTLAGSKKLSLADLKVNSMNGGDAVSMSSLKSLPEDQANLSCSPPSYTSRSYSLASALPRNTFSLVSSNVSQPKSSNSTATPNLTILNQLITKVNNYHHGKQSLSVHKSTATEHTKFTGYISHSASSSSQVIDLNNNISNHSPKQMQPVDMIPSASNNNSLSNRSSKITTNCSANSNSSQSTGSASSDIAHYNHHYFHNHHQPYGDYEESFEIHERLNKESMLMRADTPLKTRYWLQLLRYHAKDLGHWRTRRNGLANIMMMRHE